MNPAHEWLVTLTVVWTVKTSALFLFICMAYKQPVEILHQINKMNRKLWQKLKCSQSELQLKATLTGGQSFRLVQLIHFFWKNDFDAVICFRWKIGSLPEDNFIDESYIGVMGNCVWQFRQTENDLLYRVLGELKTDSPNYYNQVRMKISVPIVDKKKSKKKIVAIDDTQLFHSLDYYETLLRTYFRLNVNLSECYAEW